MAEFDIGFLGGGQLARMSIQAAQRMGLTCLSLDPGLMTPASQIAPAVSGPLDDVDKVAEIFARCDRVTLENEFIPAEAIRQAIQAAGRSEDAILPGISTLAAIQDKLLQRRAFTASGVPSPHAVAIEGEVPDLAFPMVLKSRFGGYDGRGTRYARTRAEFESYRPLWEVGGWLAEEFVPFQRELAVMVFVSERERGCFPTMETIQRDHICDLVFPAEAQGGEIAMAAVEAVKGRGLFGVELFQLESGEILVNEMAPRPHNTGHYTLDWGGVSQFEQHIRLVMDLPTIEPGGEDTCMANLLGQPGAKDHRNGIRCALAEVPAARVHWYGKAESRPGRKMGHLNVVGENCRERALEARKWFYSGWRA